ncbi:MAG TPA: hypothetical protein VK447_08140 [Myxococcaceae bacterium]|jgi:hypothetical protein|nr:hypothetical protein [Myxococcaceae bacterium]
MAQDPTHEFKELERKRWRERELKDLEVEQNRGPRPLEGFSGEDAGTTWTDEQNDSERELHAEDNEKALKASEEQIPPPLDEQH